MTYGDKLRAEYTDEVLADIYSSPDLFCEDCPNDEYCNVGPHGWSQKRCRESFLTFLKSEVGAPQIKGNSVLRMRKENPEEF